MKDSHLYKRMSNYNVFSTYLHMIKTADMVTVKDLITNITNQADDHPKYADIMEAYNLRLSSEDNKK